MTNWTPEKHAAAKLLHKKMEYTDEIDLVGEMLAEIERLQTENDWLKVTSLILPPAEKGE